MASKKYQTLSGFLLSPFHRKEDVKKDQEYDTKYRQFALTNRIRIHAMCIIEDSYYIHIKVPSESQSNNNQEYNYDVVIRFFTDSTEQLNQPHLRGYVMQFFSNSPSFMYQYAYLYKQEGFLIEALYNKLDADYIDTPPEKTNTRMIKSYDKSIYFACRFLSEHRFRYLDKNGVLRSKKVTPEKFFRNISDFKSIKMDQALISEERKLGKELDKAKKSGKKSISDESGYKNGGKKINATKNTNKRTSINYVVKKVGNKKVPKRVGTKSTLRNK